MLREKANTLESNLEEMHQSTEKRESEIGNLRSRTTSKDKEFLALKATINAKDREVLDLKEESNRKDQEILEAQERVGEFEQHGDTLYGTFLTPKGDYRFLEGQVSGSTVEKCYTMRSRILAEIMSINHTVPAIRRTSVPTSPHSPRSTRGLRM